MRHPEGCWNTPLGEWGRPLGGAHHLRVGRGAGMPPPPSPATPHIPHPTPIRPDGGGVAGGPGVPRGAVGVQGGASPAGAEGHESGGPAPLPQHERGRGAQPGGGRGAGGAHHGAGAAVHPPEGRGRHRQRRARPCGAKDGRSPGARSRKNAGRGVCASAPVPASRSSFVQGNVRAAGGPVGRLAPVPPTLSSNPKPTGGPTSPGAGSRGGRRRPGWRRAPGRRRRPRPRGGPASRRGRRGEEGLRGRGGGGATDDARRPNRSQGMQTGTHTHACARTWARTRPILWEYGMGESCGGRGCRREG